MDKDLLEIENFESRIFGAAELRASDDAPVISGHGAVFNKRSENLGGFFEIIAPGAFDKVLDDDVRGLINHDSNLIFGRTTAGTLELSIDKQGLAYRAAADTDISYVSDLVKSMQRGDITQSSFGFSLGPDGDEWDEDEDGRLIRTIRSVKRLYDVSPVTFPAYPDTDVALRSMHDYLKRAGRVREREILARQAREYSARHLGR